MIAITGANGNLGKATLSFLLKKTSPQHIAAIVRDAAKLGEFSKSGIEVRVADYEDQESLEKALAGVDRLLQISSSATGVRAMAHETRVVHAAVKCGVQEVVYTSTLFPHESARFQSAHVCRNTEAMIRQSGMKYVFFRNSMYHETIPLFVGEAMGDGRIFYPSGSGRVSFASRRDIAEALSNVLTGPEFANATFHITGPSAHSFADIALALKDAAGFGEAAHTDIPAEDYRKGLLGYGLPEEEAAFYASMADSIRAGEFEGTDRSLEGFLGRKPLGVQEYLRGLF
ncbi:NAD(P)-dependent oxidoreductase [Dyadobacter beijingensis]|uniref:NAD(P)-dependent oxidoreductase n=1 Tax=Dyadobacter beijingensis TaxID=365489 RepID=A0ABQ2I096_9BACT|nr:SDR family oxidoreductase [Dyadobacter beijingensis]GGM94417.1 NAD(P)-dependent oxidoreductase [Dyadobacter beijingensis]